MIISLLNLFKSIYGMLERAPDSRSDSESTIFKYIFNLVYSVTCSGT